MSTAGTPEDGTEFANGGQGPKSRQSGPAQPDKNDFHSEFHDGEYWQIAQHHDPKTSVLEKDIFFGVIKPGSPKEQQLLKSRVERTLSGLRSIFEIRELSDRQKLRKARNIANYELAYDKLFSLTTLGLGSIPADPQMADAALDALQSEIVDREAGRIKNGYMIRLGLPALVAAIVFALSFLAYQHIGVLAFNPPEIYKYRYVFLVLSGCMIGTWASYASRKVVLGFTDLAILEQDRIDPRLRLVFTGVLTIILTLVIATGMVNIQVGNFSASTLVNSGSAALLFGAFAGLTEQSLPAALMNRAKGFVQAVNKTE